VVWVLVLAPVQEPEEYPVTVQVPDTVAVAVTVVELEVTWVDVLVPVWVTVPVPVAVELTVPNEVQVCVP
jgi:hypothetical protein